MKQLVITFCALLLLGMAAEKVWSVVDNHYCEREVDSYIAAHQRDRRVPLALRVAPVTTDFVGVPEPEEDVSATAVRPAIIPVTIKIGVTAKEDWLVAKIPDVKYDEIYAGI